MLEVDTAEPPEGGAWLHTKPSATNPPLPNAATVTTIMKWIFLISQACMAAIKARLLAAKVKAQGITRRIDRRLPVAAAMLAGALALYCLLWWRWRIDPSIAFASVGIVLCGVILLTRSKSEHRPPASQRLVYSQEGRDLRRAIAAGFVKPRFWRLWGAFRRLGVHAVVGKIILCATLLFGAASLGSVLAIKRFPNPTTLQIFAATVGALSFWYVLYLYAEWLEWAWEKFWGKIAYALIASATVTFCKVFADQQIRALTQSNPSLSPGAQQAITVWNVTSILIAEISIVIWVPVLWAYTKTMVNLALLPFYVVIGYFRIREMLGLPRKSETPIEIYCSHLWAGVFLINIGLLISDGFGTEELLIWSSFVRKYLWLAGPDRVCTNLPPKTLVSPFNTREPSPSEVLVAQPISTGEDRSRPPYTYYVIACSKPTVPGARYPPVPQLRDYKLAPP